MLTALLLAALVAAPAYPAADPPTSVFVETPLGTFEITLFPEDAPNTVANFLKYIDDGDYDDSFLHRSVPGFIIQGGGFAWKDGGSTAVPTDDPIPNEFKRSNLRGTIAMAKVDGDPNSARGQWFINLADNSGNLDSQNGGFTVFGEVAGNGMAVVDALASTSIYNLGGAFTDLPLINFSSGAVGPEHLLFTEFSLGAPPADPLLLRHAKNGSWLSYRLSADGSSSSIEEKGKVKLSRDRDFVTVSRADFNGDREPDVLLHDAGAGSWRLATLDGKTVLAEGPVELPGGDWVLIAAGDLDGDRSADALLRNATTGAWQACLLDGTTLRACRDMGDLSSDLGDAFVGDGDFNDDGRMDILLRRANGSWLMYLMDGVGTPQSGAPKMTKSLKSSAVALADFNGDGKTDVLTRATNGKWLVYLLNGFKFAGKGSVPMSKDTDLMVVASADFSGDGNADALLRHVDGSWMLYALDGRKVLADGPVAMTADTDFGVVVADDFSADAKADVLLHNSRGDWMLYTLDGSVPEVLGSSPTKMSRNKSWMPQID
jgi:cyclophilin family peptidyl-prolyl cis-trans isomerase